MAQTLIRGGGTTDGGTVSVEGWGRSEILPPISFSSEEDVKLAFSPLEPIKIYLFNEGPGEIQISLGENFNQNSPLKLSPGFLFEEESAENIWVKGTGIVQVMIRYRQKLRGDSGGGGTPSIVLTSSGTAFYPSGEISIQVRISQEFENLDSSYYNFTMYRADLEADFQEIYNTEFLSSFSFQPEELSEGFYLKTIQIPYQASKFYAIEMEFNVAEYRRLNNLDWNPETNTLTLS